MTNQAQKYENNMSLPTPREHFIRGRTHVETVYLTLLYKVLTDNLEWSIFIGYFIDYIYKSIVIPKIILDKTGALDRHFRTLVDRAFRNRLPSLETYPDFINDSRDPLDICISYMMQNIEKLFPREEIRSRVAYEKAINLCREVVYMASMAFLHDLDLIR